jgi:hypothetical protein
MASQAPAVETCAHCSLPVAAWRRERMGRVFCTWVCAEADARIGELTAAMQKAEHGGAGGGSKVPTGNNRKSDALAAEGISRKRAGP